MCKRDKHAIATPLYKAGRRDDVTAKASPYAFRLHKCLHPVPLEDICVDENTYMVLEDDKLWIPPLFSSCLH